MAFGIGGYLIGMSAKAGMLTADLAVNAACIVATVGVLRLVTAKRFWLSRLPREMTANIAGMVDSLSGFAATPRVISARLADPTQQAGKSTAWPSSRCGILGKLAAKPLVTARRDAWNHSTARGDRRHACRRLSLGHREDRHAAQPHAPTH
ncbi:MAG: hypothetical protein ACYDCL_22260 [Myxococcales bacterium]